MLLPARSCPPHRRHAVRPSAPLRLAALAVAVTAPLAGAVGPDDHWCTSLPAQLHLLEPDAVGHWHWHLYTADSNAISRFQHRPGAGTLRLWLGDGHRPQAVPSVAYAAGEQPRAIAVAPDGSAVVVALEGPDAHGMPQAHALAIVATHAHPGDAPTRIALPQPVTLQEACVLSPEAGGDILLLVSGPVPAAPATPTTDHQHLLRIDARHEVHLLAGTPGQVATLTPVPHHPTVWVSDEQGVHAIDTTTGAHQLLIPRGEDDFPRWLPVVTPAGDRAVVVRWGAHSNRLTLVAVTVATGATEPLPGSVTTEQGVCLLRVEPHRCLLAEGTSPRSVTGVVWSVGFAHGEIHREP